MLIFDGHNDLWLHHRNAPVQAFYRGMGGGLFAIFVPPQEYIARMDGAGTGC